jgi:hypothetical protein
MEIEHCKNIMVGGAGNTIKCIIFWRTVAPSNSSNRRIYKTIKCVKNNNNKLITKE